MMNGVHTGCTYVIDSLLHLHVKLAIVCKYYPPCDNVNNTISVGSDFHIIQLVSMDVRAAVA